MCTPLPASRGVQQRHEARAHPLRGGRPRARPPAARTLRSALASPSAAATGISNWWGAYSAKKRSGSTPASISAPITRVANGLDAPLRLERERQRRRRVAAAAGTRARSSPHRRAPSSRSSSARRLAQEAARAALPRPAVGLDDVAQHAARARSSLSLGRDPRARVRVGQQAQVAGRAERVGLGERPERRERVVGGHPADARPQVLVELGREHRAPAHDRAEVAADERDELAARSRAASRGSRCRCPRCPRAGPAPRRRRARAAASSADTTTIMPPAGMSRRSSAAASRSCGLQVNAAVAQRGVGVGDAYRSPPGPRTRPTTHAKCPTSQSGGGPVELAVEQVVEQLARRSAARPTGGGWRSSRSSVTGRSSAATQVEQPVERRSRSTDPRRGSPRALRRRARSIAASTPGRGRARHVGVLDRRDRQAVVAPARFAVGEGAGRHARDDAARGQRHGVLVERLAAVARRCRRRPSASAPQKAPHRSSRWGSSRACSASSSRAPGSSVISSESGLGMALNLQPGSSRYSGALYCPARIRADGRVSIRPP